MDGSRAMRALACALVWGMILLACRGDRSRGPLPPLTPGPLDGSWKTTAVIAADTCGTGLAGQTREGVIRIDHLGDSVTAGLFTDCGVALSPPESILFNDPVVTMTKDLGFACRGGFPVACCYGVTWIDSGTLDGDAVTGTHTQIFTLFPNSPPSCAPSACQVSGDLDWQRCPPADCSFRICGT